MKRLQPSGPSFCGGGGVCGTPPNTELYGYDV